MNGLHAAGVAAAALLIGGAVTVALPQYGEAVARLVALSLATVAGLCIIAARVPAWGSDAWSTSPFRRARLRRRAPPRPEEIEGIHSGLAGRRHPIDHGPPMPPQVLRLLKSPIRVALEREGLDPRDESDLEAARELLSPLAWAVLTSDFRTPPHPLQVRRANERQVAEVVHLVLDELDRLGTRPGGPTPRFHSPHPGAP